MTGIYEKLSKERKDGQEKGQIPRFFTTGGWQLFKEKYLYEAQTAKEQYERIAKTAAKHVQGKLPHPIHGPSFDWGTAFFNILWKGWLSPSTPVLSNMGTKRGLPVSCSGGVIGDSIDSYYSALREAALLSKYGFGTSGDLSSIRPRGAPIKGGGKASGILPVLEMFVQMSRDVSQGNTRRGAWAGYMPLMHGDFHEVVEYIRQNPDDVNIGFNLYDNDIAALNAQSKLHIENWQTALQMKQLTGKGYLFKPDTANRLRPQMYIDHNLDVKASNLCTEILLHSSDEYTFTCVLSSMNLALYDEWKDTDAVFIATVFLDCVAEEFIQQAENIGGLEKAIAFTKKGRALGLGACGFHTYIQKQRWTAGSFETHTWNNIVFKQLQTESLAASSWMATHLGEPEWCEGYGVRNTHRTSVAPTKSTALIMGGVSEGINLDPAMTYTQLTPAGEVDRMNPVLLKLLKERGVDLDAALKNLTENLGSAQTLDCLTPEEKAVFKTAFETDQMVALRLASARQRYLCQGQSLNFFFSADEDEEYISYVMQEAMLDPNVPAVYYNYGKRGVLASKGECEACQ